MGMLDMTQVGEHIEFSFGNPVKNRVDPRRDGWMISDKQPR